MAEKDVKIENLAQILDQLNQSLHLEYSLIVHYPRIASRIKDKKVREMALKLGSVSVKHADIVADAITKLGGTPQWSFEGFPEETNITDIFQKQLEKEKLALRLHQQSAHLIQDTELSDNFSKLAREENAHIKIVEDILSRLA